MKSTLTQSVLFGALSMCLSVTYADEFNTYLENAKKAYAEQDFELVELELNDALKHINSQTSNALGETFPDAPNGWKVSKLKTTSNQFVGTELSKVYTKGKSKITAKVTHSSPLIANLASAYANPMLMPGEKVRIGRSHAILNMDDNKPNGEIMLLVKGKYLIQLNGKNIENKQILLDLIKAWDINTIKDMVVE